MNIQEKTAWAYGILSNVANNVFNCIKQLFSPRVMLRYVASFVSHSLLLVATTLIICPRKNDKDFELNQHIKSSVSMWHASYQCFWMERSGIEASWEVSCRK